MSSKKFIDGMLPKYPIIVNLLHEAAQAVVGKVHNRTVPARAVLEKQGFAFSGLVGIFGPGDIPECCGFDLKSHGGHRCLLTLTNKTKETTNAIIIVTS